MIDNGHDIKQGDDRFLPGFLFPSCKLYKPPTENRQIVISSNEAEPEEN